MPDVTKSPLINIDIDMVSCFPDDYMHIVCPVVFSSCTHGRNVHSFAHTLLVAFVTNFS